MRLFFGIACLTALAPALVGQSVEATFNYGEALQKSMFFYEAQRSGPLPSTNRVNWRGDSAVHDGADANVDLTGGWYDAGDHVKFGFPMAGSVTLLSWGALEYADAYTATGQMPYLLSNLRWATDYFLKASSTPNQLWAQVGEGNNDHAWWGPAEVLPMARPPYKISTDCPGTDLAAETAAALAAASLVFRQNGDPTYADTLLNRAQSLYTFADSYRGRYSDCVTDAQAFYNSYSGYIDELVWGAAWLYKASGNDTYLGKATSLYSSLSNQGGSSDKSYTWTHSWDDKSYGSYVIMAELTGGATYRADVERWLDYWTVGYNGQRVQYTAGGLAWLDQWGPLRYTANTAFLAFVYSDWLASQNLSPDKVTRYRNFAVRQIGYMLGDNPRGSSYMIGFGNNPPKNPHHRTAHGSWANDINTPAQSVHTLYGALVGGPDSNDAYADDRTDYYKNEVADDYNAGLSGALARLYRLYGGKPLDSFPQPEVPSRDEMFIAASVNVTGSTFIDLALQLNNQTAWPAKRTDQLSVRYFLTLSNPAEKLTVTSNGCSNWSGPTQWAGNLYYLEGDCLGMVLYPGGQSQSMQPVQVRITSATARNWAADWSFTDLVNASNNGKAQKAPHIVFYNQGALVWGIEPSGGQTQPLGIVNAASLPDVAAGVKFDVTLKASGGVPPYSGWTISNGSLPGGLSINTATGEISGTATQPVTMSFDVQVADSAGTLTAKTFSLTIDAPLPLSVPISTLPTGFLGAVYQTNLSPSGGIPPYTWTVQGTLPPGLVFSNAAIVGVPLVSGDFSFTLNVADSNGATASSIVKVTISAVSSDIAGTFHLQYRTGFPSVQTNQVGAQFKILNTGKTAVSLASLSVRYYFAFDGSQKLNNWCDYAAIGCDKLLVRFVSAGPGLFYLENTFTAAAGSIAPGGDSGEFQNRYAKDDWSNIDQSQDYSFDSTHVVFSDWDHVTLYLNGVLVWGKEPNQ